MMLRRVESILNNKVKVLSWDSEEQRFSSMTVSANIFEEQKRYLTVGDTIELVVHPYSESRTLGRIRGVERVPNNYLHLYLMEEEPPIPNIEALNDSEYNEQARAWNNYVYLGRAAIDNYLPVEETTEKVNWVKEGF